MKKFLLLTVVALMISIVTPLVLFAESTTTEKLRDFNTKKLEMLSYNYDISNLDGITPVADNEKIGNSARRKKAIKGYLTLGSGLGFEKASTENFSWIVNVFYRAIFVGDLLIDGIKVETGPRFYLSKTKHEMAGWYIGIPFSLGLIVVSKVGTLVPTHGNSFAADLAISTGYQWIFPNGLLIALGGNLGGSVLFYSFLDISTVFFVTPSYAVDFGIGYAF